LTEPSESRHNRNKGGFGGIRFPHVKGSDSLSFKGYLISSIILANNIGAGSEGLSKKPSKFRLDELLTIRLAYL
jgi:hypothetical protein